MPLILCLCEVGEGREGDISCHYRSLGFHSAMIFFVQSVFLQQQ